MDWFLLIPDSIRSFSLVLLNAVLAVYLYRLEEKQEATKWLFAFAVSIAVFYLMRFIQASIYPMEAWGRFAGVPFALEFLCVPIATGAYLQFSYTFIDSPYPREARIARWGSLAILFVFAGLAVQLVLKGPASALHYMLYTCVWFISFCAASVVFLRKSRWSRRNTSVSADSGRRLRNAYRAFAWLSLFLAFILVAIILVMTLGWAEIVWTVLILPGVFFFFSALAILYVSYAPEPVTFQARIVALPLATMMVALGMASVISFSSVGFLTDSRILPSDGQQLQISPGNGDAYEIMESASPFIETEDAEFDFGGTTWYTVPLDFSFPFYGKSWDTISISMSGYILLGDVMDPKDDLFENKHPIIAPLYVDILAAPRANQDIPALSVHRTADTAQLTWRITSLTNPDAYASIYLALDATGTIAFNYKNLDAFLQSSDQLGISTIWRGIHPGGEFDSLRPLTASMLEPQVIQGNSGVFENIALALRQHTHEKTKGLFALLIALSLLVLLLFPIVLKTGLLHPVERLLEGMHRVHDGERDVHLAIGAQDEIGRLMAYFNTMTLSLKEAEQALRDHALDLENRVADRTAALQKSKEQLESQAKKLQELDAIKTRFFANISHEFRTPLTLLLSPLQDIEKGEITPERIARYAPMMHRNAQRLLTLINQLLDLSKLEAGGLDLRLQQTELIGFFRALYLSFTPRAERDGLTLLFEAEPGRLIACVDTDKVEKMVVNLVANAFKFTEQGGKIRLAVSQVQIDDLAYVKIIVEDTGEGIPSVDLPRLFDRFYQVDSTATRKYEGTGIGLALVKELVDLHEGKVEVESKVGFGTTFTIHLPIRLSDCENQENQPVEPVELDAKANPQEVVTNGSKLPAKDPEAEGLTPNGGKHGNIQVSKSGTVVIIEDNSDMRLFLRDYLEKDYHVHEADNGTTGLEVVQRILPDLVICDAMMPGMDGFAVCKAIKEEVSISHIPVLLVTARASEESKLEGFKMGADDYITKPFNIEELLARLENHIHIRKTLRKKFSVEVTVGLDEVVVSSADAQWLSRIKEIVETHLSDRTFSVDMLADEAGMSTRNLQRTLKRVTSLSPHGYIRTMRLERGAQLLVQQAGTVSEIAQSVGFNDPEYFSKLFRQVFGESPSAYMKKAPKD